MTKACGQILLVSRHRAAKAAEYRDALAAQHFTDRARALAPHSCPVDIPRPAQALRAHILVTLGNQGHVVLILRDYPVASRSLALDGDNFRRLVLSRSRNWRVSCVPCHDEGAFGLWSLRLRMGAERCVLFAQHWFLIWHHALRMVLVCHSSF